MPNDSSTGGYLVPLSGTPPLEDDAFTDFMQNVVVQITGMSGTVVFPRWQPEPPNLPAFGTDWAAVGITNQRSIDAFPVVLHNGAVTPSGSSTLQNHEEFDLFTSFYGPDAGANCALLLDGLAIPQNLEAMWLVGIKLVGLPRDRPRIPELIKEKWWQRVDATIQFRREVQRSYPVLNLLSASIAIKTETFTVDIQP